MFGNLFPYLCIKYLLYLSVISATIVARLDLNVFRFINSTNLYDAYNCCSNDYPKKNGMYTTGFDNVDLSLVIS